MDSLSMNDLTPNDLISTVSPQQLTNDGSVARPTWRSCRASPRASRWMTCSPETSVTIYLMVQATMFRIAIVHAQLSTYTFTGTRSHQPSTSPEITFVLFLIDSNYASFPICYSIFLYISLNAKLPGYAFIYHYFFFLTAWMPPLHYSIRCVFYYPSSIDSPSYLNTSDSPWRRYQ